MVFSTKDSKENFEYEIQKALSNTCSLIAFVAIQEDNSKGNREFKKLNEFYDTLDYLWSYVGMCADEDVTAVVSSYSYNLVMLLSDVDVEDIKTYYRNYGELCIYYA